MTVAAPPDTSRSDVVAEEDDAEVAVETPHLGLAHDRPAMPAHIVERPERAIAAARFDLETGCEQQFDQYFQRLLNIAEGDPKKDNKTTFSDFLIWANEQGLLSKRQARETYTRYFGVKYVSLISDYSVCDQTCPRRDEIMRQMNRELVDKEQGLLKVSADRRDYYRANRLFQETELVLEATCEACGSNE